VKGKRGDVGRIGAYVKSFFDNYLSFRKTIRNVVNVSSKITLRQEAEKMNAWACLALALLIVLFSAVGLFATRAPWPQGETLPQISAFAIYAFGLAFNLVCFAYLAYALAPHKSRRAPRPLFLVFMLLMDTAFASLTFFSSQGGSSFFFEYVLILLMVYILPIYTPRQALILTAVSVGVSVAILALVNDPITLQDSYDLVILYVVCNVAAHQKWALYSDNATYRRKVELDRDQAVSDSRTDALTGLSNRMAMEEDATNYLNRDLCVAMLDLDRFKTVNDLYGHQSGDASLKMIGRAIASIFDQPNEHCYRYGGDEFFIVATDTDEKSFRKKLAGLQAVIDRNPDERVAHSISIGYCTGHPQTLDELRTCARIADRCMYGVKVSGGGRINHGRLAPNAAAPQAAPAPGTVESAGKSDVGDTCPVDASMDGIGTVQGTRGRASTDGTREAISAGAVYEVGVSHPVEPPAEGERAADLPGLNGLLQQIESQGLNESSWTVVFFDIDNFKEVNDRLGYKAGDQILDQVARLIRKTFPDCLLAHSETDHFIVFCPYPHPNVGLRIKTVQTQAMASRTHGCVFLRAGVYIHDAAELPVPMQSAIDHAKYASDTLRDQTVILSRVYDDKLDDERRWKGFVLGNFEAALRDGHIMPRYQPIVDSATGGVCGYEALARWTDPERGPIPPDQFIPILERSQDIYKLDMHMVERVCCDMEALMRSPVHAPAGEAQVRDGRTLTCDAPAPEVGIGEAFVTVNISRTDFEACFVLDKVEEIARRHRIPRGRLRLEITESALAESPVIRKEVRALREAGIPVWLDDFGSGSSTLSVLSENVVDCVKLDAAFVRGIASDDPGLADKGTVIISNVIKLCHEIGVPVVTEGVESAEQLSAARRLGSDYTQGYYHGRPVPPAGLMGAGAGGQTEGQASRR
jgi:diguanylate cyclase (GGDEF)-like protein